MNNSINASFIENKSLKTLCNIVWIILMVKTVLYLYFISIRKESKTFDLNKINSYFKEGKEF